MDERVARHWAATGAIAIGHSGVAIVARATGMAPRRIGFGKRELRGAAGDVPIVKIRRQGTGRRPHEEVYPNLVPALLALVDPEARGDPESSLRWTNKSTHALSAEMFDAHRIRVGDKTVARLLRENGYSLQAPSKTVEGKQHPDRDAQFKHINRKAAQAAERGAPFVSVDTKKKELVGNFKNGGVEWQPEDAPELVDVHDFPHQAIGKAIPYGVYDVVQNAGFVNVGTDHDTPVFAAASLDAWWKLIGGERYPDAKELFITADAGGSNGYRSRVWKVELQRLADKHGIAIHVRHTGASHLAQGTWCPEFVERAIRLEELKEWLGHGDVTTTQRYAHLCADRLNALIVRPTAPTKPTEAIVEAQSVATTQPSRRGPKPLRSLSPVGSARRPPWPRSRRSGMGGGLRPGLQMEAAPEI